MFLQRILLFYIYVVRNGWIGVLVCNAQRYEDEKKLLDHLFDPSRYSKSIRPVSNRSQTLQVNISHQILAIQSIDVSRGEICSISYLTLSWRDEVLRWNSTEFGDISIIDLPEGSYWSPLPKQMETCQDDGVETVGNVSSDGVVHLFAVKHLVTYCIIDMTLFPYDIHVCNYNFFNSKYSNIELTFQSEGKSLIDKNMFVGNQEWNVLGSATFNFTYPYQSIPLSFYSNSLTISRRQRFILVNTFLPAWLLSFINLFVPFISPDSGERLSFAITACLAMVFVNMSLVANMPRNSVEISLLSWNLLATNVMYTIGIIWSIFIICLSKTPTKNRKIPLFIQKIVKKRIKKIHSTSIKKEEKVGAMESGVVDKNTGIEKCISDKEPGLIDDKNEDDVGWYEVSRYLDKLYVVVSVILVSVMFAVSVVLIGNNVQSLY